VRRTLTVIVPAHSSVVQALTPGAVGAADAALVGVEVRSDLPLLSQRDVRPASGAPGATTGVDTPRAAYGFTLGAGHTVVDLFNPTARGTTVRLTARPAGAYAATRWLTLLPGASAQVDLSDLLKRARPGTKTAVVVRASNPVVAEADPATGAAAPTTPATAAKATQRGGKH